MLFDSMVCVDVSLERAPGSELAAAQVADERVRDDVHGLYVSALVPAVAADLVAEDTDPHLPVLLPPLPDTPGDKRGYLVLLHPN